MIEETEPIIALKLSVRAYNVLTKMGVSTIGDLLRLQPRTVYLQKNCGRKTIREIKEALEDACYPWPCYCEKCGHRLSLAHLEQRELI